MNAVHVVHVQLQLLERVAGRRGAMGSALALCDRATGASRNSSVGEPLHQFGSIILRHVRDIAQELSDRDEETVRETTEIVDILAKGLLLTEIRLQELLREVDRNVAWEWSSVDALVSEIQRGLGVLCLDRRWHLVYNTDDHYADTHLVEIAVTSRTAEHVFVPSILGRLLSYLAYASIQRTKPGGRVSVAIVDESDTLVGTVGDSGKPVEIDGLDERLARLVESGDPQSDALEHLEAALAIGAAFAERGGGHCDVAVSPSGETTVRIGLPRRSGAE